jgi:ADP-heptose:LPS heptosyltransferase
MPKNNQPGDSIQLNYTELGLITIIFIDLDIIFYFHYKLTDYKSINTILIIRLSSLGDILLTTPVIRSLKKKFPNLQIDFILREEYKDLLKFNPYINRLFLFRKSDNDNLINDLKGLHYDLVIDLQNNLRTRKLRNSVKAKSIKKFNKKSVDKFLLVKFKINRLKNTQQIPFRYADTLGNFQLDENGLDLFTGNIETTISKNENKYIGFAPGSRHFTKMWPKEYYVELGKKLNENGFAVVLFGGKDDKDICRKIENELNNVVNLSNNDKILTTAVNMNECLAIVCNDSGLMHAACAVKTPVLAVYGSTVQEFGFTPFKNKYLIIENNNLSCRPCSHIGRNNCPEKHFKCMHELTPELAYDKLIELISL